MMGNMEANEVGTAPPRGRLVVPHEAAEEDLSKLAGTPVRLPDEAVVTRGPMACPACGSADVAWGCGPEQQRSRDEIHPLVWHETAWMADTFICRKCDAGWIEPDDPEPITWVRPYWRLGNG